MPSNLPTDRTRIDTGPGTLYVVATPIGHRDDITLRAIRILADVDMVAAEDTRHTGRLLAHHKIPTRLIAYHEHNEARQTPRLIDRLKAGNDIALVSDAGTPGISDPGYRLVTAALADSIPVIPIPGASALVAALSVSGLPTDSFIFIGFLPHKKTRRTERLKTLVDENHTLVFYESPKRILVFIKELESVLGDRPAALGREMTKLHEEFLRGTLSEIAAQLAERNTIKGECTLLVAGNKSKSPVPGEAVRAALLNALTIENRPLSASVKEVADQLGVPRNRVYKEALKIQSEIISQ
ncbi:MAG: 16S rRNA (cytidine(1402)-2'-O)-methyltransferase [Thermodesulfobacteriota bacterium]|nr:16S rRNA (cytidine(1402)-2'-O)-methyltransferase [Thermodesulfobacteriota bacterium]